MMEDIREPIFFNGGSHALLRKIVDSEIGSVADNIIATRVEYHRLRNEINFELETAITAGLFNSKHPDGKLQEDKK